MKQKCTYIAIATYIHDSDVVYNTCRQDYYNE